MYLTQLGVPVHEIGHVIGFWHEHVRPDRDNHVMVNMSRVPKLYEDDYEKLNSSILDTMSTPYDLASLMHYSATVSIGGHTNSSTCHETTVTL